MLNFVLIAYFLLTGFFFYAGVEAAWPRLHIIMKILVVPPIVPFFILDVIFDATFGTLIFVELPGWLDKRFTFSQRCEYHWSDRGFRGVVATVFCNILNSILPGHCKKNTELN